MNLKEMTVESRSWVQAACKQYFKNGKGEAFVPTHYQEEIIWRCFDKSPKQVVCSAPTRAGKSFALGAAVALIGVNKPGSKLRIIAPTQEHTKIIMGYVIDRMLDSKFFSDYLMFDTRGMGAERLKKELTKSKLTLKNGSEIQCISANITGAGRSLVGWGGTDIIVDEAEQIPAEVMRTKVMRMLGDSEDGSIFMIGNPVTHGYMWEKSMDPNWLFLHIGWEDAVRAGRMTREFVLERKEEMTGIEFDIWYNAVWPKELEDQLFSGDCLRNISVHLNRKECELLKTESDEKRLGVDVARFGNDLTVLSKLERYDDKWFITGIKKFSFQDTMKTVGSIVSWNEVENFDRINVDDTGLGGGVTDRLREIGSVSGKVFPFIAGELPNKYKRSLTKKELEENKKFLNKKAFCYKNFEFLASKGWVRLACSEYSDVLLKQLRLMKYEFQSSGKLKVVDPEDKSPDFADSVNIGLFDGSKFGFVFV